MRRTILPIVCSATLTIVVPGCSGTGSQSRSSLGDGGIVVDSSMRLEPNTRGAASDGQTTAREGREPAANGDGGVQAARGENGDEAGVPSHGSAALTADAGGASDALVDGDAGLEASDDVCTSCGDCEETQEVISTMHTNMPVAYADPPPTSGPHNPCWARWGIHDEALQAERWVHNLEHGGVVLLHNCPDGCDGEIASLRNLSTVRSRTVVARYPSLPKRFAVVSWGHRLVTECLDERAFSDFYTKHFDRGPESNATPPNPSCPP